MSRLYAILNPHMDQTAWQSAIEVTFRDSLVAWKNLEMTKSATVYLKLK